VSGPLPFALTVLLQLGAGSSGGSAGAGASLTAVAQSSARPRECSPRKAHDVRSTGVNIWESVRQPNLDRYCSLVARGFAELAQVPKAAYDTAVQADRAAPGHAAPFVLMGRAAAGSGSFAQALGHFERAKGIDARSLEDPGTMRDLARTLAHTGRAPDALGIYRALAPRLALFFGGEERAAILIEAADLAFGMGPVGIDDAVAFLEEARQIPLYGLRARALAELALALDRHRMADDAKPLLSQLSRDWEKGAKLTPTEQGTAEVDAAVALALEAVDPAAAAEGWQRYLAGPAGAGPWGEHARARLEALRKRPAGARRKP
jgi:hypothetical protein